MADDLRDFQNFLDNEEEGVYLEKESNASSTQDVDVETSETDLSDGNHSESGIDPEDSTSDVDYKEKFSNSTSENQRLMAENEELKQFKPIYDELKSNPKFFSHVENYFDGGGDAPKSILDEMGIEQEDFIFDPTEALRDPESASGKVFNRIVEQQVERKVSQAQQQRDMQLRRQTMESELAAKHDLSEDDMKELQNFTRNHKYTIEDAYILKSYHDGNLTVKDAKLKETKKQSEVTKKFPRTAAKAGGQEEEKKSFGDSFFSLISQDSGKELDEFLNG